MRRVVLSSAEWCFCWLMNLLNVSWHTTNEQKKNSYTHSKKTQYFLWWYVAYILRFSFVGWCGCCMIFVENFCPKSVYTYSHTQIVFFQLLLHLSIAVYKYFHSFATIYQPEINPKLCIFEFSESSIRKRFKTIEFDAIIIFNSDFINYKFCH